MECVSRIVGERMMMPQILRRYSEKGPQGQLLGISGRYLDGTTPDRTQFQVWDTSDWTLHTNQKLLTSEADYIWSIADDEDYIYMGLFTATAQARFCIYSKSSKSFVSGVYYLSSTTVDIIHDDNYIYPFIGTRVYKISKSDFSTATFSDAACAGGGAIGQDANNIYGFNAQDSPKSLVVFSKSDLSYAKYPIGSALNFNIGGGQVVCLVDDTQIYIGGAATSTGQKWRVVRKSDYADVTNTQHTASGANITCADHDNDYVYFGTSNGGLYRVVKSTRVIEARKALFNGAIRRLICWGDNLLLIGNFTGTNINGLALVPKSAMNTVLPGGFPTISHGTFYGATFTS